MKNELAKKIYLVVLKQMNGWEDEDLFKLTDEEIVTDPVYEGILNIIGDK